MANEFQYGTETLFLAFFDRRLHQKVVPKKHHNEKVHVVEIIVQVVPSVVQNVFFTYLLLLIHPVYMEL